MVLINKYYTTFALSMHQFLSYTVFSCEAHNEKKCYPVSRIAFLSLCGRWDLNPHACNKHKILSLARLPVPTLPRIGLPPTVDIICMIRSFVNNKLYLFLFFSG